MTPLIKNSRLFYAICTNYELKKEKVGPSALSVFEMNDVSWQASRMRPVTEILMNQILTTSYTGSLWRMTSFQRRARMCKLSHLEQIPGSIKIQQRHEDLLSEIFTLFPKLNGNLSWTFDVK